MRCLDAGAGGYPSFHGVVSFATCKVRFGAYAVLSFTAVSGRDLDVMRFPNFDRHASNKLYVTSSLIRPVIASEFTSNEVVGEGVCSSKLSGVSCGTLRSTNVCTSYNVCAQRLASGQFACGGDSGSPVYYVIGSGPSARALGVLVAGTAGTNTCPDGSKSGSDSVYTHIEDAGAALHLFVATSTP